VTALVAYRSELERGILQIVRRSKREVRLLNQVEMTRISVMQHALVAASTVLTELQMGTGTAALARRDSLAPTSPSGGFGFGDERGDSDDDGGDGTLKLSDDGQLVGIVEVAWRGRVERTVFPLPLEIEYLMEKTKNAFLDKVPLYGGVFSLCREGSSVLVRPRPVALLLFLFLKNLPSNTCSMPGVVSIYYRVRVWHRWTCRRRRSA
jgi:hypothetical protein